MDWSTGILLFYGFSVTLLLVSAHKVLGRKERHIEHLNMKLLKYRECIQAMNAIARADRYDDHLGEE